MSNNSNDKGLKQDREKKWEKAQIKAFKSWMNSYLEKRGLEINDITEDLKDGVRMLTFLEIVKGTKIKGWSNPAHMKIHQIQNANIAIQFIQGLGVRLVGVGAENIVDGNVKLTLGLLWSLFKKIRIESIEAEGQSSEDGLLAWLRKMTQEYDGIEITDFKESFRNGMAFSALIHKFKPEAIDFDSLDPNNAEENLRNAFEIAETQLGIPKLLDVEDMLDGTVDERSLVLYNSLFFHAYVADEERRKEIEQREREKKEQEAKMNDRFQELEEKVKVLEEQNETLLKEKETLLAENAELHTSKTEFETKFVEIEKNFETVRQEKEVLEQEKEVFIEKEKESSTSVTELQEKIELLTEEVKYLKTREIMDTELRELLENKVGTLELLLEEKTEQNVNIVNEKENIDAEIDGIKVEKEKLSEQVENLEEEKNSLLTDAEEKRRKLQEMESKKSSLMEQIKKLKDRVTKEIERQKEKQLEIQKLKETISVFQKKQIVETKARVGLDVLKKNLEDHLEDLYRWRDINDEEFKEDVEEFDLSRVISDISMKGFEEQLNYLDEKLQEENRALQRIIQLKDSEKEIKEITIKQGWLTMKGRKEWKKRWFKLSGSRLTYYEDQETEDISGCIQLDKNCDVVRQKAVKEDQNSNKKAWPLKITVGERKLFVRAQTKKERHAWFLVLTSSIAHLSYTKYCEENNLRPDTRVLNLFDNEKSPSFNLNCKEINDGTIYSLIKGLPGRDEIEDLSLSKCKLNDSHIAKIGPVLEKLNFTSINLSHNELTSDSIPQFIKTISCEKIEIIDLSNNQINDEGICLLAEQLPTLTKLSVLNLSNNNIGDAGASALADALAKESVNIPTIQLSNNNIGDEGADAFAKLLESDKNISTLCLHHNNIGDDGAFALSQTLADNTTLNTVNLSHNNLGSKGALAIRDLLKQNKDIITFDISNNPNLISGNDLSDFLNVNGFSFSSLVFNRNI
eukprot:TRINITY_DN2158_c0_g2_i1.p1 TRINITY_DN2158_c0_g2~~TRINITY_DN2158_c0_g2_i1.p1  ORF type:complete len:969 (+),score=438.61 TRINITY_DN2158_c0_g2_i1:88-2994(+)